MEQTDNNAQAEKPKISRMAIASLLVVIIGFVVGSVLGSLLGETVLVYLGIFILLVSPVIGLILGIIATWKIRKSKGALKGRIFSILGIILGIIFILGIFLPAPCSVEWYARQLACQHNMNKLGLVLQLYNNHYKKYPTPEIWCDLLLKHADVNEEDFVCIGALKNGDKGRCHYAINPYCTVDSPRDTVLLFETKGGWNQYGGPELLTNEHHIKENGCNILYNDNYLELVWSAEFGKLKWGKADTGLDDSCELFIGKLLEVKPIHGWGWYWNKEAPEPPEGFKMRLKSLWQYDSIRKGGIAKIETKGHIYDGWTAIFNTRFLGTYNFSDKIGDYEIYITEQDILYTTDDGWPYPKYGNFDSCSGYCVIEACSQDK